jgi:hypothetical protein
MIDIEDLKPQIIERLSNVFVSHNGNPYPVFDELVRI